MRAVECVIFLDPMIRKPSSAGERADKRTELEDAWGVFVAVNRSLDHCQFQSSFDHVPGPFLQFATLVKASDDTGHQSRGPSTFHQSQAWPSPQCVLSLLQQLRDLTEAQRIILSYTNTLSLTTHSGLTYGSSCASFLQSHQPRFALFPQHPDAYPLSCRSWKKVISRRFHDGSPAHVSITRRTCCGVPTTGLQ